MPTSATYCDDNGKFPIEYICIIMNLSCICVVICAVFLHILFTLADKLFKYCMEKYYHRKYFNLPNNNRETQTV